MQMGRASSAHSAQRMSLLIAPALEQVAYSEGWGLIAESGHPGNPEGKKTDTVLWRWAELRKDLFWMGPREDRLMKVVVLQDDPTVVIVGERGTRDATARISGVL